MLKKETVVRSPVCVSMKFTYIVALVTVLVTLVSAQSGSSDFWKNCPDVDNNFGFEISDVSITPDPPKIGDNVNVTCTGYFLENIEEINITFSGQIAGESIPVKGPYDICGVDGIICPYTTGLRTMWVYGEIPALPAGQLSVIANVYGRLTGSTNTIRLACLDINLDFSEPNPTDCDFTSNFNATFVGNDAKHHFEHPDPADAVKGDWLQVGPAVSKTSPFSEIPVVDTWEWGDFIDIEMTGDLGDTPYTAISKYLWSMSAILETYTVTSTEYVLTYSAVFMIGYEGEYVSYTDYLLTGSTNDLVYTFDKTSKNLKTITGTLTLPDRFHPTGWPSAFIFGRLAPITVELLSDKSTVKVHGEREVCVCPYDPCQVCGGDGSSCASVSANTVYGTLTLDGADDPHTHDALVAALRQGLADYFNVPIDQVKITAIYSGTTQISSVFAVNGPTTIVEFQVTAKVSQTEMDATMTEFITKIHTGEITSIGGRTVLSVAPRAPPAQTTGSGDTDSSFPWWAGVIIGVLVVALLGLVLTAMFVVLLAALMAYVVGKSRNLLGVSKGGMKKANKEYGSNWNAVPVTEKDGAIPEPVVAEAGEDDIFNVSE